MHSWLKLTWVETKLFLREPGAYIGLAFPYSVAYKTAWLERRKLVHIALILVHIHAPT